MVAAIVAPACATTAVTTPAARFWEENLPGTPMPPTIAELVQKGTDHSPLKQPSSSPQVYQPDACLGYSYRITCSPSAAVAATGVFFRQENVALGSVMTVHFPPVDLPAILPRADAEKAPFANVSDVLATFSIASGSSSESNVRTTISACQAPPLVGEHKTCATSLEGAVRAAARMLGTSAARLSVTASALTPREGLPRQEYEVVAVAPLGGGRRLVCPGKLASSAARRGRHLPCSGQAHLRAAVAASCAAAELACVARPPHHAPWRSSPARCGRGRAPADLACALGAALRAPTQFASTSSRTGSKRGEDQDPFFFFLSGV